MGDSTKIEWTDATWNPVVGCTIVSPGCTNCYAMKQAARLLDGNPKASHYAGTTRKVNGQAVWTGKVALAPEHILTQPLRWKRPRKIFVNSMADLFHEDVPDEWINRVFAVMALAPQHTFQVLTKRSARMNQFLANEYGALPGRIFPYWAKTAVEQFGTGFKEPQPLDMPLPNVWLGVSAEDQKRADERLPDLRSTPAAIRFVSFEPLLGPIENIDFTGIHWAIVGGESGHGARPMHPTWERSIRLQCADAHVAYLGKQWGQWAHMPERAHFKEGARVEWQRVPSGVDGVRPALMFKVGKKAAGRLFDGVERNGVPEVTA
ncbi:phage Gp37/Gp68 family protein [Labrys sp. ZIDIC5]|uniref:phage Gp37/Gp68 family protein n=1 Tax=Labrys sedimenti TaxID=3106036 RepID=UPI002ACA7645|nr:phage Gp37/Gp68 family protein [Labrys sp. ZIDIC5]MDZ5448894.1 phage Gp37/Gp68 family protein [Labrys sp. ZIDIC5]